MNFIKNIIKSYKANKLANKLNGIYYSYTIIGTQDFYNKEANFGIETYNILFEYDSSLYEKILDKIKNYKYSCFVLGCIAALDKDIRKRLDFLIPMYCPSPELLCIFMDGYYFYKRNLLHIDKPAFTNNLRKGLTITICKFDRGDISLYRTCILPEKEIINFSLKDIVKLVHPPKTLPNYYIIEEIYKM